MLGGGTLGARLARFPELPFRVFEDKGDGQVDLVAADVAVLDQHVHILDPGALDIPKAAGGTVDGCVDRVLETLLRGGA